MTVGEDGCSRSCTQPAALGARYLLLGLVLYIIEAITRVQPQLQAWNRPRAHIFRNSNSIQDRNQEVPSITKGRRPRNPGSLPPIRTNISVHKYVLFLRDETIPIVLLHPCPLFLRAPMNAKARTLGAHRRKNGRIGTFLNYMALKLSGVPKKINGLSGIAASLRRITVLCTLLLSNPKLQRRRVPLPSDSYVFSPRSRYSFQ